MSLPDKLLPQRVKEFIQRPLGIPAKFCNCTRIHHNTQSYLLDGVVSIYQNTYNFSLQRKYRAVLSNWFIFMSPRFWSLKKKLVYISIKVWRIILKEGIYKHLESGFLIIFLNLLIIKDTSSLQIVSKTFMKMFDNRGN